MLLAPRSRSRFDTDYGQFPGGSYGRSLWALVRWRAAVSPDAAEVSTTGLKTRWDAARHFGRLLWLQSGSSAPLIGHQLAAESTLAPYASAVVKATRRYHLSVSTSDFQMSPRSNTTAMRKNVEGCCTAVGVGEDHQILIWPWQCCGGEALFTK